jgi:hypothetical protein
LTSGYFSASYAEGYGHRYGDCTKQESEGQIDDFIGEAHLPQGYGASFLVAY